MIAFRLDEWTRKQSEREKEIFQARIIQHCPNLGIFIVEQPLIESQGIFWTLLSLSHIAYHG